MVADHLCRFKFDVASWQLLNHYVPHFIWVSTHINFIKLNQLGAGL